MSLPRLTRVVAVGAALGMTLAFAPAMSSTNDLAGSQDVSPLVTAADFGLDFAPQLVTVNTATLADRNRVVALGLDVTEHAGHDYVEVVLTSADQAQLLLDNGFTWDVRIEDMIARQSERIQLDALYAEAVDGVSPLPSGRTGYRALSDFGTEIDDLVSRESAHATRLSIGRSVEGRDLVGIEIGLDIAVDGERKAEDGRPSLLMFGAHHAREWPSAEAPMEFAHDLVQGIEAGDERILDLLSRATVIIVPVSNPDGYDASRTSGDLLDGNATGFHNNNGPTGLEGTAIILGTPGNAYKRKNCRYIDGQTQPAGTCALVTANGGYGVGIDLNRNYGALWGGPGAFGATPDPDQLGDIQNVGPMGALYRGPAPFSEPETQAIRNLISTRQVTTLISNHTFSNLLLRPVGVQPSTIAPDGFPVGFAPDECYTGPDGAELGMQELGERMTAQTGYSNQFGWELYDTTGTTEDYSYNATGGFGYTFEIGADEFHPPYESFVGEYTGDAAADRVSDHDDAEELTTGTGDSCGGDQHDHDEVAGGLRTAYLIALENAADARTHSLITGSAPAGSTVEVSRTGTFPLWDETPFADTVKTSILVGDDGEVEYHLNPSTRPFVDSRDFVSAIAGTEYTDGGTARAFSTARNTWTIDQAAEGLSLTLTVDVPNPSTSVRQINFKVTDPTGKVIADGAGFENSLNVSVTPPGGILPGDYTVTVTNTVNAAGDYTLDGALIARQSSPKTLELWTVTCTTPGGEVSTQDVAVDRGQSVDLGSLCA